MIKVETKQQKKDSDEAESFEIHGETKKEEQNGSSKCKNR